MVVKYGQTSKAVQALQNGLHRALAAKGLPHTNNRKGGFGSRTRDDLLRFRRAYMTRRGPISGRYAGSDVWKALEPFLGAYDQALIRQHRRAVAAARAELQARKAQAGTRAAQRARVKAVALRFYALRAFYVYRQYRPMPDDLFSRLAWYQLDCSSSFTLIHKAAGLPDPNGRGYDGQGYTGTLINQGTWKPVASAEAGDGVFYGDQGAGVPRHVVCAIGDGLGVSFGSTPIRLVRLTYRSDLRSSGRDYLV
jgi:hypothetical protein